ncbi:MAG TPA: hypothetical protein VM536_09380 [Chloroflexia bacterium]|nr:hypothetical protein [Chloroflexia bacterium]
MARPVPTAGAIIRPGRTGRAAAMLLVAAMATLAIWAYVLGVLIPARREGIPPAPPETPRIVSDLYTTWHGSRALLLEHRDPYGAAMTGEIQTALYGEPLDPMNRRDPRDPFIMVYPAYVAFEMAPLLRLTFSDVQWVTSLLFAVLTALTVPLWLTALGLHWSRAATATAALLVLSSYAAVTGITVQQPTLWVVFLLAAGLAALVRGRYAVGGVLLALATIKPQLVALLLLGLAFWTGADLRRRQGFLWGFGGTMLGLLFAAELLDPDWMPRWFANAVTYAVYEGIHPVVEWIGGPLVGMLLQGALISLLTVMWIYAVRARAGEPAFAGAVALTLAVTHLIAPLVLGYNQVILVPALLLLAAHAPAAWASGGRLLRYAYGLLALVVGWYWIAALAQIAGAVLASLTGNTYQAQTAWTFAAYAALIPLGPLVVFAVLALVLYRLRLPPCPPLARGPGALTPAP